MKMLMNIIYAFSHNYLLISTNLWFTGWIYKLYMGLLAVFCTNSINIHAGLNGLEVGQTVVIAFAVSIEQAAVTWSNFLFFSMTCLTNFPDLDSQHHANWSIDGSRVQAGAHVFYLSCSTPISHIVGLACLQLVIDISCCTKFVVVPVFAFWWLAWFRYPSSVFVGDTYTYFAGMTMAVVGILGHFRCVLYSKF